MTVRTAARVLMDVRPSRLQSAARTACSAARGPRRGVGRASRTHTRDNPQVSKVNFTLPSNNWSRHMFKTRVRRGRCAELVVLLTLVCACAGYSVDLKGLLRAHHQAALRSHHQTSPRQYKRFGAGQFNQCTSPEKPFPCRDMEECIPLEWICDDNYDCSDGYDEDPDVCTAAHRPVVGNIKKLLDHEKTWMMPNLFGGKSITKVAHALAVAYNVEDFADRLGLDSSSVGNLRKTMEAIKGDDKGALKALESLGMPKSSWNEVSFFFKQMIKSGFTSS